jgi:hypothetical protein
VFAVGTVVVAFASALLFDSEARQRTGAVRGGLRVLAILLPDGQGGEGQRV